MTMTHHAVHESGVSWPARLSDQAVALVRAVAPPSLVSLVLRLGLAVPFWKSGVLKWDGFLRLNDTALYLLSDEFKLHCPAGRMHSRHRKSWRSSRARRKSSCRFCWCLASALASQRPVS